MLEPINATKPRAATLRDLEEMANLKKSRGWSLMVEGLMREEAVAIRAIIANPTSTKEELDFLRASLRAIKLMIGFPEIVEAGLMSDLQLSTQATPKEDSDAS